MPRGHQDQGSMPACGRGALGRLEAPFLSCSHIFLQSPCITFMITKVDTYKTEAAGEFKAATTPLKNQPLKTPLNTIHVSPTAAKSKYLRSAIERPRVVAPTLQAARQEVGLGCSLSIPYVQAQEEERARTEAGPRTQGIWGYRGQMCQADPGGISGRNGNSLDDTQGPQPGRMSQERCLGWVPGSCPPL